MQPGKCHAPNAGKQFFKVYLSAQPAEGLQVCMAIRDGGPHVLGELTREGSTHPRHFFFSTVHGAFSFWCIKKKMGGAFSAAKRRFCFAESIRKWTETSTFCKSLLHRIKPMMDRNWFNLEGRMEQKIKQDINIGANIRAIRKQKNIKQVDLVRLRAIVRR